MGLRDTWCLILKESGDWLGALSDVIFPRTCQVCGRALVKGEEVMCLDCMVGMPRTNFHISGSATPVTRMTAEAKIIRMACMFFYSKKSGYAAMLKKSKYNGHPEIDRTLGKRFATELMPSGFFDGVDLIVPVPMFRWKKLWRGFNQAEEIARGVSMVTGISIAYNLEAVRPHSTQTKKSATERRSLSGSYFGVYAPDELQDKHILLVDDIVTTGGTVAACSQALRDAVPSVRISLLSLAHTAYT